MRIILSTMVFVVLTALGAIAWSMFEAAYRDRQRQKIDADVVYAERLCPQRQPLLVEIENGANLPVGKVRFDISGHDDANSAPVRETRFGVTVRRIIASDGRVALCFRLPDENPVIATSESEMRDPRRLIWRVEITSVEFL